MDKKQFDEVRSKAWDLAQARVYMNENHIKCMEDYHFKRFISASEKFMSAVTKYDLSSYEYDLINAYISNCVDREYKRRELFKQEYEEEKEIKRLLNIDD